MPRQRNASANGPAGGEATAIRRPSATDAGLLVPPAEIPVVPLADTPATNGSGLSPWCGSTDWPAALPPSISNSESSVPLPEIPATNGSGLLPWCGSTDWLAALPPGDESRSKTASMECSPPLSDGHSQSISTSIAVLLIARARDCRFDSSSSSEAPPMPVEQGSRQTVSVAFGRQPVEWLAYA